MHATRWRALEVLLPCVVLISLSQAFLVWVGKPQNRAVALGDDLILPCQARWIDKSNSSVILSYTWSLNGGNLTSKASRLFNNSLFIWSVSARELGNYSCTVTSQPQEAADLANSTVGNLTATAVVIEAYIEPFIVDPVSLEGSLEEQISLTCVTGRSAPSVQVHWLKDNEVFTGGESFTAAFGDHDPSGLSLQLSMKLTLKISTKTLSSFQCVAVNDVLKQQVRSQQANVTQRVVASADRPVVVWNLPHRLIVAEGKDLMLPCQVVESTEPAVVDWYAGRYKVDESKRLYVLPNASLGFLPVGKSDSGNYSCAAQNSKGVTWSPNVELIVAYLGLTFLASPCDAHAIYGQDVILKCSPPESIPPAVVIWYKNYLPLDLHPGRVMVVDNDLHLTSVMKSDNGLYYCVAFNNLTVPSSRTSTTARLRVEGPPLMVQPPVSTKIAKGKLLHLICLVDSDPAPVTTWQFEDRDLPLNSKVVVVNQGQELFIADVGKQWEGRFVCLSTNKYGSTSASCFVTVLVPPASLKPIGNITALSGNSVLVPCPVICDPMPVIGWFVDGQRLSLNGSLASAANLHWIFLFPDLYIQHVQPEHAGKYSCTGSNEAGNATSTGWLIVHTPPVISQAPTNTTAVIGASVTLNCQAKGNPLPSLSWLHNATMQMPNSAQVKDNNSTLVLLSLGWDNVGTYSCVAQSSAGTSQTTALVQLMIPPTIEAIDFPTTPVRRHSRFNLSCMASGIPAPLVKWTHFDEPIMTTLNGRVRLTETGMMVVEFAWKNDSGLYECWASSSVGTHKKMVSIVVYGPPSPPVLLRAVPLSAESVYLIWEWSDHGDVAESADTFQLSFWDKINGELSVYPVIFLNNETRAEVVGLQPATEYIFCVSAINNAGTGPPSNLMSAVTLQSFPSVPVNLHVAVITATNVTLTWEVPSSPNGNVKMYQLRYKTSTDTDQDNIYVNITDLLFPSNDFVLSPLLPYTEYLAQVRAGNVERGLHLLGNYSSVTFHTLASKPSLPPQFVQANAVDPYSLNVTWQPIPALAQNGPVLYYHVTYTNNESQRTGNAKVNSSETSYLIKGLSPWRFYLITVRGENQAGLGPVSDVQRAITLPVAPMVSPGNFQVSASSASSLKLSWKALQGAQVTCNITAYIVEFRQQDQSAWFQVSVPSSVSASSFIYLLESLLPWTWYECRVAAFTSTVTPGMGPFTDVIVVRTLQGVSSAVSFFSYTSNATVILLSWKPPKDIQGILSGYWVVYKALNNASAAEDVELTTTSEAAVLQNLLPDTVYNITVAAGNAAGWGEALVILIHTLPDPTVPDSSIIFVPNGTDLNYNASSPNNTAYLLSQNDNSHITKNLASIVAGSIVGAIALIVMTVFVCIKCIKYRQKQRLTYDVDTDTVGVDGTSYRSLEPTSDIVIISSSKLFHVTDSHPPAADTHSPHTSPSALDEDVQTLENIESRNGRNIQNDKEEKRKHSLHRISLPILSLSASPYSVLKEDNGSSQSFYNEESKGVDNLGFVEVNIEPAEDDPRQPAEVTAHPQLDGVHLSVTSDDTISVSSETRRRNRMRNDNALAIAAMRNSQTICPDDTEALMDFEATDSEVIFNERTVL